MKGFLKAIASRWKEIAAFVSGCVCVYALAEFTTPDFQKAVSKASAYAISMLTIGLTVLRFTIAHKKALAKVSHNKQSTLNRHKSVKYRIHRHSPKKARIDWLRAWGLFRFVLPRKVQEQVFEPLFEEFKEDYLLARRYKTKWARRWLKFCFTAKTIVMVFGCLRAAIGARVFAILLSIFLPEPLRRFFGRLWKP